tara:strand:+ start:8999 stop:9211 length:213 start_codon:yes stop_codon:yes gene_type:complete
MELSENIYKNVGFIFLMIILFVLFIISACLSIDVVIFIQENRGLFIMLAIVIFLPYWAYKSLFRSSKKVN